MQIRARTAAPILRTMRRSPFHPHVGAYRDHDYSSDITAIFTVPEPGSLVAPLDGIREVLDPALTGREVADAYATRAAQVGILALTAESLLTGGTLGEDRPSTSQSYRASKEIDTPQPAARPLDWASLSATRAS